MLKMQDEASGGFYHMVKSYSLQHYKWQDSDIELADNVDVRYIRDMDDYGAENANGLIENRTNVRPTSVTADAVAALAYASHIFQSHDATYANLLLDAAEDGWAYLQANPTRVPVIAGDNIPYGDNDQYDPHKDLDNRLLAAALYRATGDSEYHDYFKDHYLTVFTTGENNIFLSQTDNGYGVGFMDIPAALMYFAADNQDAAVMSELTADYGTWRDMMVNRQATETWQTTLMPDDYYWGSNFVVLATPLAIAVGQHFLGEDMDEAVALGHNALNYVLGVNPLQQSYVTGYGENPVERPFSMIYNFDFKPGVPPGIMVGGANGYNNPLLYPNFLARSYQDNAASWSANEHTIYWNPVLTFNAALVASATEDGTPTAALAYSANALAVAFDGSPSSDSDGSIVSYAWDFGDGTSATGVTASHTPYLYDGRQLCGRADGN